MTRRGFILSLSILFCGILLLSSHAAQAIAVVNDYNGDRVSDLAVYDTTTGNWYIRSLGDLSAPPICFGQNWGGAGLVPVPGDYNGDGLCDLAVYDQSTGNWYIRSLGPVGPEYPPICFGQNWGGPGLIPVAGDYNNDGVYDLAVFQRATGNWFIRSLGPVGPEYPPICFGLNWGNGATMPVSGDYDGDGLYDLAVRHMFQGSWFIRSLKDKPAIVFDENYGKQYANYNGWYYPISFDIDGDGTSDPVFCESYHFGFSTWCIPASNTAWGTRTETWGGINCVPVAGDYNKDGKSDLTVYDTSSGNWFIRGASNANELICFAQNWGGPNLIPIGYKMTTDLKFRLITATGATHEWHSSLPARLRADAATDPTLNVYVEDEYYLTKSYSCYINGSEQTVEANVANRYGFPIDPITGASLLTGLRLRADYPDCPSYVPQTPITGPPTKVEELIDALDAFNDWRYHDAYASP